MMAVKETLAVAVDEALRLSENDRLRVREALWASFQSTPKRVVTEAKQKEILVQITDLANSISLNTRGDRLAIAVPTRLTLFWLTLQRGSDWFDGNANVENVIFRAALSR